MSNKVTPISLEKFRELHNVPIVDLVSLGLFDGEDCRFLEKEFGYLRGFERLLHLIKGVSVLITNPGPILKNIDQVVFNQLKDFKKYSKDIEKPINERYPISDYINKASIVSSFSPKNILEIGTFYGWGAASFKVAAPRATIYTINPEVTDNANNPIRLDKIGEAFKKKNLEVNQIWADSTKFDFTTLPKIDVTYIDGNHDYEFVYKDLENTSKITEKAILLDDYIPDKNSPRGDVRAWGPWNESVVRAVNDFLYDNEKIFKYAYWIEHTPICVLIK